jgi:hypothetical protein
MKSFKLPFLVISLFVSGLSVSGAVLTVSNNPAIPALYTTPAAAIKVANPGDTIYIHGSPTQYDNIFINKSNLTLIGAGYNPQKDNAFATVIKDIYLDTLNINQTGRGAHLIGLNFGYLYAAVNGVYSNNFAQYTYNNVTIERSYLTNSIYVSGENWTIKNCYLSDIGIYNHGNLVVANNIIFGATYAFSNSTKSSVLITNNDFYEGAVFYTPNSNPFSNGIFSNNICYGASIYYSPTPTTKNGITMNNNLTFNLSSICFTCPKTGGDTLPISGNFGTGNITNQNPAFVGVTAIKPAGSFFQMDFHLTSNSPAKLNGSDKTDIGITGGPFPWIDNTGSPNLPEVKQLNITNVVPLNGSINIQVKGKTHN